MPHTTHLYIITTSTTIYPHKKDCVGRMFYIYIYIYIVSSSRVASKLQEDNFLFPFLAKKSLHKKKKGHMYLCSLVFFSLPCNLKNIEGERRVSSPHSLGGGVRLCSHTTLLLLCVLCVCVVDHPRLCLFFFCWIKSGQSTTKKKKIHTALCFVCCFPKEIVIIKCCQKASYDRGVH